MKKIFILLCFILTCSNVVATETANFYTEGTSSIVLEAQAEFDWVDMSQIERDTQIQEYKDILFDYDIIKKYSKKEFKEKYSDFLKDKNWKEHYRLAILGVKQTENANICAFFFKKDILLVYALQYKENPYNVYYYNAYGNLQYVDEISENYPNFPYSSKQYRKNGKLISAIYFTSHDTQYMYEADGEFNGLWHKDKMYDKNGKQKVTRTNW